MQKLKLSIEISPNDETFKNILDSELSAIGWVCSNELIYELEFGLDKSSFQKYGELLDTINILSSQITNTIYVDLISTRAVWN